MASPKRIITLEIDLDANGDLRITIPHGSNQQRDANAAASFTDKLAKAIGTVKERHIGDHEHHHHDHNHGHNHHHHNA